MKFLFLFLIMIIPATENLSAQNLKYQPKPFVQLENADWTKNATIYELNIRQFSREGSFKAIEKDLPRLKKMGIDIIWLMPANPIGKKNRKGSLGSYYSVKNYLEVSPEFGTEEDFKHLVASIHRQGMHVILDWVANHSSWDNPLATEHPEWYMHDAQGNFVSTPWRDYDDIIEFDYDKPALREYMTEAMKFWVKKYDIDGFRCDVASFVPLDFWENVRRELWKIKPVFMLAESQDRDLHRNAFDATYAWELYTAAKNVAKNDENISAITENYITELIKTFPKAGIRMNFTDNHDKNSWEGNQYGNFGEGLRAMMVLMATVPGMPLVYNGQEAGLDRSLKFFDKDPIDWKKDENQEIYTSLFALKHQNKALWNGKWGGGMLRIKNDKMNHVISYRRDKDGDRVLVFINLSKDAQKVKFETMEIKGNYFDLFSKKRLNISADFNLTMKPWEYLVLTNTNVDEQ